MQKKLATGIVLSLVCLPAMAETGFYTGVGIGQVTLKDNIGGLEFKATDTGFKLFGGYRFNELAPSRWPTSTAERLMTQSPA